MGGRAVGYYLENNATLWPILQAESFQMEEFGLRLFQQPAGTDFSKNACKPVAESR